MLKFLLLHHGYTGTHVCHAHEAGNLCRHAQVAEEALVSAPEATPQDVAAPGRLVIRRASLRTPLITQRVNFSRAHLLLGLACYVSVLSHNCSLDRCTCIAGSRMERERYLLSSIKELPAQLVPHAS